MKQEKTQIRERIEAAQKVVVGIGQEFADSDFENSEVFRAFKTKGGNDAYSWMLPFLKGYDYSHRSNERLDKGYNQLAELLEEKDYFIITELSDDRIYSSRLKPECITAPCGSYTRVQCEENCKNVIMDASKYIEEIAERVLSHKTALADIERPVCPACGKPLAMNVYPGKVYCEEGYLSQWNRYQKWLSCTMNRELLLIEAGVGFQQPGLIRFPFEKVAFIQNKAHLFRINEKLPQLTQELSGKGTAVHRNAVEFFENL